MCAHRVVWEPPKGVNRQHKAHIRGGIEPRWGEHWAAACPFLWTTPFGSRLTPAGFFSSHPPTPARL